MSINLTDEIEVKTKKGKLGAAKQIFLEGDTQTVENEIQDINSRHNDLNSKHESLSSTVSEHTNQIESNQNQITANKSTQDAKNASLDANMAKLNTRDDQITELVRDITATGGASVATTVTYDNTSSHLASATVQGAIDELQGKKVSFAGIATPTTNPGTPDGPVFYIANGKGTYTNFGGIDVTENEVVILYYDTVWHKKATGIASNDKLTELEGEVYGKDVTKEIPQVIVDGYFNTNPSIIQPTPSSPLDGTKCCVINVKEGDKFKIYGKGNSGALQLYALVDASYNVVYKPNTAIDSRENGLDVVITEGVSYLIVNLWNYNDTTDKVVKIETTTVSGITDRVDRLEKNVVEVIDSLDSQSTSDALSANQGFILDKAIAKLDVDVNGLTEKEFTTIELLDNKYFNTNDVFKNGSTTFISDPGDFADCKCVKINVVKGEVYNITGNGGTNAVGLYVLTDIEGNIISSLKKSDNDFYSLQIEQKGILYINLYTAKEGVKSVIRVCMVTQGGFKQYSDNNLLIANQYSDSNLLIAKQYTDEKVKKAFTGKTIVCFGDSITEGVGGGGYKYTDKLAELSGANVINVGIGGTQLRQRRAPSVSPSNIDEGYAGLDIINMIKAACSQNFEIVENSAEYVKNYYPVTDSNYDNNTAIIQRLKSIDWNNVDIVTIFAGTNDWNNGSTLGVSGTEDVNTTLGAINEIIKLVSMTYPHMRIYFFTPIVRYVNKVAADENWSDTKTNREGKTLADYVSSISSEVKLNHIPICDMYYGIGLNKYTLPVYSNDLTHPNKKGYELVGSMFYSFLQANCMFR